MKQKIVIFIVVLLMISVVWAATRNFVPRADGEGSLGTVAKNWGAAHIEIGTFDSLVTSGTITADTINEYTGAAGVTIDGVLLKDNYVGLWDTTDEKRLKVIALPGSLGAIDRFLRFDVSGGSKTIVLTGSPTLGNWFNQSVTTGANPTFVTPVVTSLITGGDIGVVGDTDLLQLAANSLTINGTVLVNDIELHSTAECRFYDNGNYVGFEAPALTADQIWVLPTADGSADEIIKTDGSGTLSFIRAPKAIYAELSDSTDQEFAVAGTHYSITFDTNDELAGITHSTSDPNITIDTTGVYTIFAQPQVAAAAGGAGTFHMWLQKDAGGGFADIANTNIELSLASLEEDVIPLATTFLLTAGDIIRLRANVSDNKIKLDAQAAVGGPPTEPAIPSIIFTMFMIGT